MASEKRLIDANAVLKKMQKWNTRERLINCVEDAPTVDAVEVVRCKDCKQWIRNGGIAESPNGHCFYHDIDPNGYDFCSYGERRK